jgi:hypothetical protein
MPMRINVNQLHGNSCDAGRQGWPWMRYFQLGLTLADREIGDPLINSLMGSFLIEVLGIFLHYFRQMLAMKDEGMVQAFSS